MNQVKRLLPNTLKKGNLNENGSKREEFRIPHEKDLWKKCKYLGSLMDTESIINRRKGHTVSTMKALQPLLKSHTVTTKTKLISRVFSTTKTIEDRIDSFQWKLLRQVMGVRWPEIIKNKALCEKRGVEK